MTREPSVAAESKQRYFKNAIRKITHPGYPDYILIPILGFAAVFLFLSGAASNYIIFDSYYQPQTWIDCLSNYGLSFASAILELVLALNLVYRFSKRWQIGLSALVALVLFSIVYPIYTLIASLASDDHSQAKTLGILIALSIVQAPFVMLLAIYLGTYHEEIVFKILGDY